jgi:RNA polymerase sigma-70 factor (ECF subfamily)
MTAFDDETELIERLRARDSKAFRELVATYQAGLIRLAESFVPSRAVAEEVVQETWIAVIKGIARFEHRSSLKTWISRILVNIARTKGVKERRTVPIGSFGADAGGPAVPASRFSGPPGKGGWSEPPVKWSDLPDEIALGDATISTVVETIQKLPEQQRWVVMLRDVEDWSAADVCELLGLTEVNQRVLLHRGRSAVRGMLESVLGAAS